MLNLDPVKRMRCEVCDEEITVNANYPITEVTCLSCHAAAKRSRNIGDEPQSYGGTT